MDGVVFALLLLATGAACTWAVWPRRDPRRLGGRPPRGAGWPPRGASGTADSPGAAGADSARSTLPAGTSTPGAISPPDPTAALQSGSILPGPPLSPSPDPGGRADESSAAAGARPARRARLFAYGTVAQHLTPGAAPGIHVGDYACLHALTTGFAPARERLIELAVLRCDPVGRVLDTWSTLLHPRRDEVEGAALHGITPAMLLQAPTFADVADEFLGHCGGCVVVAHNAGFVESFLAVELLRAGVLAPTLPALDLMRIAPLTVPTPNVRLATLARVAGRRRDVPSRALDDARLVAALLPLVVAPLRDRITYDVPPASTPAATAGPTATAGRAGMVSGRGRGGTAPILPRAGGAPGTPPAGWLADLMVDLAMGAAEGHDPRLAAYLDALTNVLATGGIVAEEVRELTRAAVRAGYPAAQLRAVLERLLESMRGAAFARGPLTQGQVRHLRAAALSLGVPQYFDDLVQAPAPPAPPPGSGSFSRPVRTPPPPPAPAHAPRCGHCLQVGHYTAACPRLRRRGGGRGPIGGVPGLGPIDPIQPI